MGFYNFKLLSEHKLPVAVTNNMNRLLKSVILLILILNLYLTNNAQGYEIKVKINNLSDTMLILGHYLNKSMYPDDTTWLDKKGSGVFKGNNKLPGGMYIIFLPSTKFFEVLIDNNQKFYIETDTSDFIENMTIKGSEENIIFNHFQKYMTAAQQNASKIQQKISDTISEQEREKYINQLKKINETRIARTKKIIEENKGLFISTFLKATLDIEVPDPPKDDDGNIIDSTWQYYYFRNHYFDNFDISDARLLRTPIYEDKIMNYVMNVIPQIPDSIIPEIDMLINKSKADSSLFRFMLITLFNYYGKLNIMGMDAVQIHIADKYYITEAWWSDPKFITGLKERVEKQKPLLIGEKAINLELIEVPSEHFIKAENDTALKKFPHAGKPISLYSTESDFIVLLFWEADCGHCKKVVPKMYEIYQNDLKAKNVKVLAISTLFGEEGKIKWVDFVNKYGLYDWINAWNPYSYEYKVKYDILATPQILILDNNKIIVAKKIGPEQAGDIIDTLIKQKKL